MARAPQNVPCHYVYRSGTAVEFSYGVFGAGVLLKLYFLYLLWRHQDEKLVKRMQPLASAMILLGGTLLDGLAIWLPGPPTLSSCLMRPTWASLAFIFFFSPLAFKTIRVW